MSSGAAPIRFTRASARLEDTALVFEHLVQINDPDDARIPAINRGQLWRGLQLRMQFPQNFQPGIDSCVVTRLDTGEWLRVIDYGRAQVRDRVRFFPPERIEIEVLGSELSARLEIRIEAPEPDQLWLRFCYDTRSAEHQAGTPLSGLIRDAWRQADEETVFRIRQLAASGLLDDPDVQDV